MNRPVLGHRSRVRVEFSLAPDLAEKVYGYARQHDLTLSQAGSRLIIAGWRHLASAEGSDAAQEPAAARLHENPPQAS